MEKFDLIVLGGGVAGAAAAYTAASMAKEEGEKLDVALVSDEEAVYSRGALPSLIANEVHSLKEIIVYPTSMLEKLGIKYFRLHEACSVNFKDRLVLTKNLENGKKREINFEKLIICTGSVPEILQVKGVNLKGVYAVKWFKDAEELSKTAKPRMRALVVGPGFIGMATANALVKRGLKVTVLARTRILSYVLEPFLGDYVHYKAEAMGLKIMSDSQLQEIGGHGKVEYAKINDEKFDFDIVVLAIGVKPRTEIFSESGLDLTDYGAVKTDKKMQTSMESIYSVGDCAEKLDLITGKKVFRPLGSLATRTAEIAGLNALGAEIEFEGSIRRQYDYIFGLHVTSMGLTGREAQALGVNTESLPVKVSVEASHHKELLKRPYETKMCVVIEKGTERIVGWQSVGTLKLTNLYSVYLNELIKNGKKVADLQEAGLKVS
ncbi:FAD-dependent oxidoreductase [Candidatus Bathyarchaeota archaeon]|nr:FAD-dependent oxidoreductase [Candidatus Bathyarchaeota archaeon]